MFYMFLLPLLELFLVLYPSHCKIAWLAYLHQLCFCTILFPMQSEFSRFWPRLCHLITHLRFLQFQTGCKLNDSAVALKKESDCAPSLTYSVCTRCAEYVEIHWEWTLPKAGPFHKDKWVLYTCSVLVLKSSLHQNHLLQKT